MGADGHFPFVELTSLAEHIGMWFGVLLFVLVVAITIIEVIDRRIMRKPPNRKGRTKDE